MTGERQINVGPCCRCDTSFCLPEPLYDAAKKSADIWFYCPYGHKQHYPEGPSVADKLRQERDLLKQRIAQKDDEIISQRRCRESAERSASAYKGQATRLRKRAKAGVCPCCTRHFDNLQRHIASKHPDFDDAPDAPDLKVMQGGK